MNSFGKGNAYSLVFLSPLYFRRYAQSFSFAGLIFLLRFKSSVAKITRTKSKPKTVAMSLKLLQCLFENFSFDELKNLFSI